MSPELLQDFAGALAAKSMSAALMGQARHRTFRPTKQYINK
jgi:hypothetical protein